MPRDALARRVAAKELALFFASPVAWLFLGSFAAVSLFVFFWGEAFFARNIADVRPLFEWMPVLLVFLCAALTMRMWSEERRTGTLEHVLTQPAPLWKFVIGKFQACVALLLLALLITAPLPLTVALHGDLDWGPVFAGYLAAVLLGAAYLSAGLFVSARSDNPIVSLIGSVALCGALYLLGSGIFTSFFGNFAGEVLRALGSGARFEAITRGVLDIRDMVYYLSLAAVFLCLNIYSLERERWAAGGAPVGSDGGGGDRGPARAHHRRWRRAAALVVANALALNLWLSQITALRADVTEGRLFSISDATHSYLAQLQEPLLLRGYFSAKTHPLLAPLVPQMRDLLKEYEVAGKGRVRVEIVDPADNPELEDEANNRYGIRSVPFQVADRYQSAVVNSYFNVLVEYGDSYQTLGFDDLIEVKADAVASLEVQLRNPEFDLTRAIRQALYSYQAGGNLFASLDGDIELRAYITAKEQLPEPLQAFRDAIDAQLAAAQSESGGRFSVQYLEPEAGDGELARRIGEEWGFKPMVVLGDDRQFYFYMVLADEKQQAVQLPLNFNDAGAFRESLDAALKRFARGFTKVVAFSAPTADPAGQPGGAPGQYRSLEGVITENHSIRMDDLASGAVASAADMLVVAEPRTLSEKQLFAIDQFLMRGGSVVLITSSYVSQLAGGALSIGPSDSGLDEWLAHHGLSIEKSLVLDPRNAAFPLPVVREVGPFRFQEIKMVDYPYFVDARPPELDSSHPITSGLQQLTMTWPSPIVIDAEKNAEREVVELARSSAGSWVSNSMDVVPRAGAGENAWQPEGKVGSRVLAAVISGRFDSWFAGKPSPLLTDGEDEAAGEEAAFADGGGDAVTVGGVIERSPESARLLLYASNDFLMDAVLGTLSSMSGTQYAAPLEMMANTLDWVLEDGGLLAIRSHSHFNRALAPMEKADQLFWEYLNYGLALAALAGIALWQRRARQRRRRAYREQFGEGA